MHSILHELVDILVVLNSIFILKVTAKSEHYMVGSVVAGLLKDVLNKSIHTVIHIVVKQIWVVL